jgi:CBS domain-containing protein
MSFKRDTRRAKKEILEQLSALRDEGRVQLHLLSLDAKQRWLELEKQVTKLEASLDQEGEKAAEVLQQAAHDLRQKLTDFMTQHLNRGVGLLTSARSLMSTHVRACSPDDSLAQAAQLMWNNDCGAIPVLADDKVLAVITDRDVCMATFTQGRPPSQLQVKDAMSKQLFSCAPDASIASVLATMADKHVRRLPVVSGDAKLVGIISLADVARWAKSLTSPAVDAALTETLGAISGHAPHKLPSAAE